MLIVKKAKDTITPVELNVGDTVIYTLSNGFANRIELIDSSAAIVETNKKDLTTDFPPGGTLLRLDVRILINGLPMHLRRFIGSQESFYEPYVINGMQLWFDAAKCMFELIQENHGACKPQKDVRFVLADDALTVCPERLSDWCEFYGRERIDIADCYDGDDCYLGAYHGASAHGGLDINHPGGTPVYAPFALDDQYYFHSLRNGEVNNRWRGIRHWSNETAWVIQVHHIGVPSVDEYVPVQNGTEIAKGAMVYVGNHPHSHFVFKIYEEGYEYVVDPWMLFRQMFKQKKEEPLRISVAPQCCITGERIVMQAAGTSADAELLWKLSDGSCYCGERIQHVFAKPGVYSVLLYAKAAKGVTCTLQYVTVMGNETTAPRLSIEAEDRGFAQLHPPYAMTFGEIADMPNALDIAVFESDKRIFYKTIQLNHNSPLPWSEEACTMTCSSDFVTIDAFDAQSKTCRIKIDTTGLDTQEYLEKVDIACNMLNGNQTIWIKVAIMPDSDSDTIICSCADHTFWKTGYTLVGHQFKHWYTSRGYRGIYLTNGCDRDKEVKAVFQPVLKAGKYKVGFVEHDKLDRLSKIKIKVSHKEGATELHYVPEKDLEIGTFMFDAGNEGRVEIWTGECTGPAIIDAVYFARIG